MEEESWMRNHGGGIMEEESWRGGIMEEESWRMNHGGGIMEEEPCGRHLRSIWQASERRLGSIWEASGRLLGGIWEAGIAIGGKWCLGGKMCQIMCVLPVKVVATAYLV